MYTHTDNKVKPSQSLSAVHHQESNASGSFEIKTPDCFAVALQLVQTRLHTLGVGFYIIEKLRMPRSYSERNQPDQEEIAKAVRIDPMGALVEPVRTHKSRRKDEVDSIR